MPTPAGGGLSLVSLAQKTLAASACHLPAAPRGVKENYMCHTIPRIRQTAINEVVCCQGRHLVVEGRQQQSLVLLCCHSCPALLTLLP